MKVLKYIYLRRFLIGVALCILYALGVSQYISDSELWPITLAKQFGNFSSDNTSLYYKILFLGWLKIPYYIPLSNAQHILFVKYLMATVGIGIITLFYQLVRRIYHSGTVAMGSTILLLSTQAFFSQYSRIRSDLMVCFVVLISFCLALGIYKKKKLKPVDVVIQSALMMAAFLFTPKAIYWIVLNGVFNYFCLSFLKKRTRLLIASCLFALPFSILLLLGFWLQIPLVEKMDEAWVSALMYFNNSDLKSWMFPGRLLSFDGLAVLAVLSGVGLLFKKGWRKQLDPLGWACIAVCILACLAIIVHNQKVPFFIASLLPFIFLPVGHLVDLFLKRRLSWKVYAGVLAIFLGSKWYSFKFPELYWTSNTPQIEKIDEIETALKAHPDSLVFDGLGLMPRYSNIYIYIEPVPHHSSKETVEMIQMRKPDVVLWHNRSSDLYPYLYYYLEEEFTERSPGFWARNGLSYPPLATRVPLKYYFLFEPLHY